MHLLCSVNVGDPDSSSAKAGRVLEAMSLLRVSSEIPKEQIEFDIRASQALIFELLLIHSSVDIEDEDDYGNRILCWT